MIPKGFNTMKGNSNSRPLTPSTTLCRQQKAIECVLFRDIIQQNSYDLHYANGDFVTEVVTVNGDVILSKDSDGLTCRTARTIQGTS